MRKGVKDDNITYTDVKLYDKDEKDTFSIVANRIEEKGGDLEIKVKKNQKKEQENNEENNEVKECFL